MATFAQCVRFPTVDSCPPILDALLVHMLNKLSTLLGSTFEIWFMSTVITGLFNRDGISSSDFRVGPRVDVGAAIGWRLSEWTADVRINLEFLRLFAKLYYV